MSQYPPQPPNQFSGQPGFNQPMHPGQPDSPYDQPPTKENTLGLTGFIISLVGLFLCGIPSLIGLIVSAIGLKKEPKGLAIAGVIIGLIGLIELAAMAVMTFQTVQMAKQGFTQMTAAIAESQMEQVAAEVGHSWKELERCPTQEEGDEMMLGETDTMSNSLVYETDGSSFSIRSAGADGILETEDDIIVGPYSDAQTAIDLEVDFEEWDLDDLDPEADQEDEEDDQSTEKSPDLMEN